MKRRDINLTNSAPLIVLFSSQINLTNSGSDHGFARSIYSPLLSFSPLNRRLYCFAEQKTPKPSSDSSFSGVVSILQPSGYVIVPEKLPNYVVPDLTDFKLKLYVSQCATQIKTTEASAAEK
ncbi:uncharacterized protein LOC107260857 isoform X1 [Ricinus communis]|uniref:uncharacterized protein LOC107260857 isoform X1 n=1 Tax=Ricinus communis TaxID=3988 RepID=UPI00201AB80A|nr:uncharacterized protein LOC107260857 isoform X1 [Ricinus communis]